MITKYITFTFRDIDDINNFFTNFNAFINKANYNDNKLSLSFKTENIDFGKEFISPDVNPNNSVENIMLNKSIQSLTVIVRLNYK